MKHLHAKAAAAAERLAFAIKPGAERVEIAGSIRRCKPEVKDIELVCEPKLHHDMFGEVVDDVDELMPVLRDLLAESVFRWRDRSTGKPIAMSPKEAAERCAWGRRYCGLVDVRTGMPVDLFIVRPPAQWGAIMAIRTGPADYSKRLVTKAIDRGYRCEQGRLVVKGPPASDRLPLGSDVPTPEERDFIVACGMPYIPPEDRK